MDTDITLSLDDVIKKNRKPAKKKQPQKPTPNQRKTKPQRAQKNSENQQQKPLRPHKQQKRTQNKKFGQRTGGREKTLVLKMVNKRNEPYQSAPEVYEEMPSRDAPRERRNKKHKQRSRSPLPTSRNRHRTQSPQIQPFAQPEMVIPDARMMYAQQMQQQMRQQQQQQQIPQQLIQQMAPVMAPAPVRPPIRLATSAKIFVSNLPNDVSKDDLFTLFSKAGDIKGEVEMHYAETGEFKGTVTIRFKHMSAAKEALHLNEASLDGRPMKVQLLSEPGQVTIQDFTTE
eukprot:TRINITY_DN311_c2_g1_i1.p2 TRINITY_DN311_c2_g1~~TRINITY_DN311_c2_g1_i1.p2  ORF type:complete len:286 (-),score=110.32 TRINITY_DN311_c2_g1_i1:177-1034(-)